jgi:hypothetical protein
MYQQCRTSYGIYIKNCHLKTENKNKRTRCLDDTPLKMLIAVMDTTAVAPPISTIDPAATPTAVNNGLLILY